jgi:hypothetical protein
MGALRDGSEQPRRARRGSPRRRLAVTAAAVLAAAVVVPLSAGAETHLFGHRASARPAALAPARPGRSQHAAAVGPRDAAAPVAPGASRPRPATAASAGGVWVVEAAPAPLHASSAFNAVACPTAGRCVAVGATGSFAQATLAESWNRRSWVVDTPPVLVDSPDDTLDGVTCVSAVDCVAVGSRSRTTSPSVFPTRTLAERWNGTAWSVLATPNVAGYYEDSLVAVACPRATDCIAVGTAARAFNKNGKPISARWNGHTWRLLTTPDPYDQTDASLASVSCATARSCVAVGKTGNDSALIERWNGTRWTIQSPLSPQATYSQLNAVSCPTTTFCLAVGTHYTSEKGTTAVITETWNGRYWTAGSAAPLAARFPSLTSIDCSGPTRCVAVGSRSYMPTGRPNALAERWNGATWTIQATQNPAADRDINLESVSCGGGRCTAVGSSHFGGNLLVERYQP